jgi:glucose/arabinose dehydrogenase
MQKCVAVAILLSIACARETVQAVAATNDPALRHYEIRADQLPRAFATPSAGNPPRVTAPPKGATLRLPPGFAISVFASDLEDARNMILAPNGDVIVSQPGMGRITILRDANHDGVAELRFTFASNLNSPYGLALHDGWLYVGNEDAVVRFPYTPGATRANGEPQKLAPLPPGGHSTRGILFNRGGNKMYVSVGSASNDSAGEPPERAAIVEFNPDGTGKRIFASGLRNPVGMAWEPVTGALWATVNERDGFGDDLVPDYITDVREGAFYGWPYGYIGRHEDPRHRGERPAPSSPRC